MEEEVDVVEELVDVVDVVEDVEEDVVVAGALGSVSEIESI